MKKGGKKGKKGKNKNYFANKKFRYIGIGGIIVIIAAIILTVSLRENLNITGNTVSVEAHGISNTKTGQQTHLQTDIELKKSDLESLKTAHGRVDIATQIAEGANLIKGISDLALKDSPVPIPSTNLKVLNAGAGSEIDNFKTQMRCLRKIGEIHWTSLKLVLISELMFQQCNHDKDYLSAHMKHTYYSHDSKNRFLCDQNNDRIFLINKETGAIVTDTTIC